MPMMDVRRDITPPIAWKPNSKLPKALAIAVSLPKVPKVTSLMMRKYERQEIQLENAV